MNTDSYQSFIDSKAIRSVQVGFEPVGLSSHLFEHQRLIARWAVLRGRAAIFAGCGMGKTLMQLEWAREVAVHAQGDVLILAPLAVARQTVEEGARFGIAVNYCREPGDIKSGINITNYERLDRFIAHNWAGVVLDESSILKSFEGSTRNLIIQAFQGVHYRLACTATPAPNDHVELGNHAEFLGVMSRVEMLATFFAHDGGDTSKWRLKGHAVDGFWRWVCEWAVMVRKPSDLGLSDEGFTLPPLDIVHHKVKSGVAPAPGMLVSLDARTLDERREARRSSLDERVAKVARLVKAAKEPWAVWCNLNAEADALVEAIPGAVQVSGADTPEEKEERIRGFVEGRIRVLVSKPSICGFGMNFQHCAQTAFCGVSDSFEEFFQTVRRFWRFGQKRQVDVHVVTSTAEGAVVENLKRKEAAAEEMADEMARHMTVHLRGQIDGARRQQDTYRRSVKSGDRWTCHLGDCVEVLREVPSDSVGYTVTSTPFSALYTYSNSAHDFGNCSDDETFNRHMAFLAPELLRVTQPGRLLSLHCMLLPSQKAKDGVIGLKDFRGDLIRMFQQAGWIFHAEVTIWKDPVIAVTRTKALGLLHKQLKKDSAMSRQGIPDYLVTMRKPGENKNPITHTAEDYPVEKWQRMASPCWMDIRESDTLQYQSVREEKDERHICPLQLEVIRRGVELWSNPGDLVLDPFGGIGSVGHVALKMGRRALTMELKESYWRQACANLDLAANPPQRSLDLFRSMPTTRTEANDCDLMDMAGGAR